MMTATFDTPRTEFEPLLGGRLGCMAKRRGAPRRTGKDKVDRRDSSGREPTCFYVSQEDLDALDTMGHAYGTKQRAPTLRYILDQAFKHRDELDPLEPKELTIVNVQSQAASIQHMFALSPQEQKQLREIADILGVNSLAKALRCVIQNELGEMPRSPF